MIDITYDALDSGAISARVTQPTDGAIVTFVGVTRNHTGDRNVLYLEYEAYRPMADNMLAQVAEEMKAKWPIGEVAISHRLGRLEIGEASLVVAVAASHRKEAFEACQYSIDRIKKIVPIWKKEFFEDGQVWVESPESRQTEQQASTVSP